LAPPPLPSLIRNGSDRRRDLSDKVFLAPIAASALGVVMLLAMLTYVRRHEMSAVALNLALLVMAAIVAWARFGALAA